MVNETYCRLCAKKIEHCIKIYEEEGEKLNLATKIIQCLQIWLYPEDVLPKTVCADCCSKVNIFFDFFQICSQSQISLMSMFKDKQDEDNVIVTNIEEISSQNTLDHEYEEDCNSESRDDSVEYTDLAVPEKSSSKRKLRTPIKCSVSEEDSEINLNSTNNPVDCQHPNETRNRRCKNLPKTVLTGDEDEDEEEENEDEDEPKLSGRVSGCVGLEGYVWKCTDCATEFKTVGELRIHHSEVHNQAPIFACIHCSKSYTHYRSFARHVKMHSDPKRFSCEICGKSFSQKTVLQSHATVHSEERPHSCAQCGKCFKQFSSLYLHSKCHLPDQVKPKFSCTDCPKQFSTKHTLETHLKIHTGERNFVCDICGKRFIAKGSLDYHILTHNDTKPHPCTVCGKGFKTARLLSKHSTLHTGVKPHQCDVCGKQFRERGALREHNRIHTGAMPYSCEFCGKLFRFKGILTVHRRQHTGERPYSCVECHRDFTNWANYNKHMKRRHRSSDHNSLLANRLLQRQTEQEVVVQTQPPPLVMHAAPPPPSHYNEDSTYKIVEDDMYRVPSYMSYLYTSTPTHQHTILQTRDQ